MVATHQFECVRDAADSVEVPLIGTSYCNKHVPMLDQRQYPNRSRTILFKYSVILHWTGAKNNRGARAPSSSADVEASVASSRRSQLAISCCASLTRAVAPSTSLLMSHPPNIVQVKVGGPRRSYHSCKILSIIMHSNGSWYQKQ